MDLGLEDKVAIVTGGSEGIGKYTAMALAAEGANVVICARRPDVLEEARAEIKLKTGRWVTSVSADVREPDQVERVFDETAAAFGGPDILVNNAGTASTGAFVDVTDDDWKSDLDLKLFAAHPVLAPCGPLHAKTGRRAHRQRHQPRRQGARAQLGANVR